MIHPLENSEKGFALYRLPQTDMNVYLKGHILSESGLGDGADGFVFAPFHATRRSQRLYLISDEKGTFSGLSVMHAHLFDLEEQWLMADSEPTTGGYYLKSFDRMMDAIRNGLVQKVVLSKLVHFNGKVFHQIFMLYDALCAKYPGAFVSVFASGASGIWIGASPELLLDQQGQLMQTVALAGTQRAAAKEKWRSKEIMEQQLVTDFVLQALNRLGAIRIQVKGPDTISAGEVVHLRTHFSFEASDAQQNVWALAEALHPTPAVGGFPKQAAMDLILNEELHEREYYSGFLGPFGPNQMQLYVNIRCMKLTHGGATLFVGGGLTLDSAAEEEWLETELKARTLLSVLDPKTFEE